MGDLEYQAFEIQNGPVVGPVTGRRAAKSSEHMSTAVNRTADTQDTPATPMLSVEDRNGVVHELEAVEGWRLMEILREYGLGMENTCGGALACAECHVVLDADSAARVPAPRDDELEKLDELPLLHEHSRLSCQIIWSDELQGLRLRLAEET